MPIGNMLRDRQEQYVAQKDNAGTWRILDTWHEDLTKLSPEDEIDDSSDAVIVLSEGGFLALVREATRLGVLQNAAFEGHNALEDENIALREQILALEKNVSSKSEEIQHVNKSEGFLLKEMAMQTMLKLTSMSDIEKLTND